MPCSQVLASSITAHSTDGMLAMDDVMPLGWAASACTAGDGITAGTIVCDSTHGTPGGTTGSCTCTCAAFYGGIDCATGGWSMHRSLHASNCMHRPFLCIHASQNRPAYL